VEVGLESTLSLLSSGLFMVLSLLSIVYGALRCNILAIKIKYDEYDVKVKPLAYVCIFLWRSFEIVTRVIVLLPRLPLLPLDPLLVQWLPLP